MDDNNTPAPEAEAQAETPETPVAKPEQADATATEAESQLAAEAEGKEKPDAEAGDDTGGDQSKKNRQSARSRIKELTSKRYEAEAREKEAVKRAERAEARLAQLSADKPRREDFDDPDEFTAALTAHQSQEIIRKDRESDVADAKAEAEDARNTVTETTQAAFREREADFMAEAPDYVETVQNPQLAISDEMAAQIAQADLGPQIAYWLGKNPGEAARISRIGSATEVAREMGRIEGRLNSPPPRRTTQAPEPVKTVAKGTGTPSQKDPSTMTPAEYRKWREAKA